VESDWVWWGNQQERDKLNDRSVDNSIKMDREDIYCEFYICGSVHHQSILLNNERDAAVSSCIYSSLQGYSVCFGCFLHPSSGVQLKLQMQS
jgi:hypothetical protein